MTSDQIAALALGARDDLRPHYSSSVALNPASALVQQLDRNAVTAPPAVVAAITNGLSSHPVLRRFARDGLRLSTSPGSGAGFGLEFVARWILAQTRHGDPLEAIGRLEALIEANAIECLEVTAVWGLNPSREVDLYAAEGIRLVRLDSVPSSQPRDELLEIPRVLEPTHDTLRLVPRPRAALVRSFRHAPLFLAPGATDPVGRDLALLMDEITLALSLVTEKGSAPIAHWFQLLGDPPLLTTVGGWGGKELKWAFIQRIEPSEYDAVEAHDVVASYLRLVTARPYLRETLTWLNRSMLEAELRDKALELGIALECLLLKKGDSKKKTIARRGAQALGGGGKVLEANKARLETLYELRSRVAHEGTLPEEGKWVGDLVPTAEILRQGIRICADLTRIELRTGQRLKDQS